MPALPGGAGLGGKRCSLQEGRLSDVCHPPSLLVGTWEGMVEREPVTARGPQSFLVATEMPVRQAPPRSRSKFPGQHPLGPNRTCKAGSHPLGLRRRVAGAVPPVSLWERCRNPSQKVSPHPFLPQSPVEGAAGRGHADVWFTEPPAWSQASGSLVGCTALAVLL